MNGRTWNKMLVVSLSLAGAGVLACAAALFDTLVPKGSVLGFLGGMAALGIVVTAVVVGFVWVCDKCEAYLSDYTDRLLSMRQQGPRPLAKKSKQPPRGPSETGPRHTALLFSPLGASAERYVESVRGTARPMADAPRTALAATLWHGQ
jgi:hypothetical protein